MKTLTAAIACVCALGFAATGSAVGFGANDDTGKYSVDGGAVFFAQMAAANLEQNVMTVRWNPDEPTAIADKEFLDRSVPAAVANGVEVVFAVYPYPPRLLENGGVSPAAFAEWLTALAQAYPEVTTYIVGNEPNLNTFWRPQGDGAGKILSGASFGPFLAAGYDALKAVSPAIKVLGVGSSPRGDRAPGAASKTAPVYFLASLGAWYRSSYRMTPLMDGFSFHPYPNPSDFTVPLSFTYGWPNASVQELPRIKQALWDAFRGTPQRTTVNGLELYLDEVGWQVDTTALPGYEGVENVPVTSEQNQAAIYAGLVRYVVCDPDVAQLNFFGYYDEHDRAGWQSALRRTDGTERASNAVVAAAIAATGGTCQGALRTWTPLKAPEGASVGFSAIAGKAKGATVASYVPSAAEDVVVKAAFVPAGTKASRIPALLRAAGRVDANRRPRRSMKGTARATPQVLAVSLTAVLNPARVAVFTSKAFVAGGKPCTVGTGKVRLTKTKPCTAGTGKVRAAKTKPTKPAKAVKASRKN